MATRRSVRTGRLPAFACLVGCLVLLYGFFRAPDFAVDRVVVRGITLGSAEEVAMQAGVIEGSIFRVDPDAIAARVAQLPYVERARVRGRLPDAVVIEVTERSPLLVWSAGGQVALVDARGHVLFAGEADGLPRLESDGPSPVVGGVVSSERISAAVAVSSALGDRLVRLSWSESDGMTADLADGRRILFGAPEDIARKLAVAEAVLDQPFDWTTLDVREPERPYYQ